MPGIRRNIAYLGLSQGVGIASGLVMVALTTRYLGVERFGQQSVLRSTALFALPLFAGGLNIHIVRAIAQDPEGIPAYLGNILALRWCLGLTVGALLSIIVRLLPLTPSLELASYSAILLLLSNLWISVPRAILIAYERNEYNLLMGVAGGLVAVALTVVAIRLDTGVAGTLAALAASDFAVAGVAQVVMWRRLVRPRFSVDLARWREIMRSALPLGLSGVLRRSYTRVDVWLLAALDGSAAAALFSVAYRVALTVNDISRMIGAALLPRLTALAKNRRDDLRTAVECSLRLLMIVSMVGAGLAAACAAPVLLLLAGPKFEGSVVALRLISVVCVTALPDAVLFLVLVALGRERIAMLCLAATVAWNIIADSILIPLLSVRGACYGTISAEWLYFGLALYLVQKELRIPSLWSFFARLVLSGLGMAGAVWLAGPGRPVLGATAGLVVLLVLSYALRVVPRGTVRRLRQALAMRPAQAAPEAAPAPEEVLL
ncbi:MAG: flippase [Armatimonadota bacterium]